MICSQDQKPGASLPRFAPWLDGDAEDAPAPALGGAAPALGGASLLPLEHSPAPGDDLPSASADKTTLFQGYPSKFLTAPFFYQCEAQVRGTYLFNNILKIEIDLFSCPSRGFSLARSQKLPTCTAKYDNAFGSEY